MARLVEPQIQLNEVEATLRQLLIDVAAYINPKKPSELRFTGGWVRDKLLGTESVDVDVAINDMTGFQFGLKMKEYLDLPGNGVKYGISNEETARGLHKIAANPEKSKHLETVTTKILGLDIDLVNLRQETYTEDSRNPQMLFGTPEQDALRRDSTINALFYNLQSQAVEDLTERGLEDMRNKIIRTPLEPYQTFKDDPLRVLRLIRFAARFDFSLDQGSINAMQDHRIQQALRAKISRERIGVELEKMMKGRDPYTALATIAKFGLYSTIFTDPTKESAFEPETDKLIICLDYAMQLIHDETLGLHPILARNNDDAFMVWMMAVLSPYIDAPDPPATKAGGKQMGPAAAAVTREGIKASHKICDVVTAAFTNHSEILDMKSKFIGSRSKKTETGAILARDILGMAMRRWGPTWRNQIALAALCEATATHGVRDTLPQWRDFLAHMRLLDLEEVCILKPLVDGKELAKALDTRPGPWMKDALDVVMAWQLRNPDSATKEGAIEAVRNKSSEAAKDEVHGEIISNLISHFLQLTIRPLFKKTRSAHEVTAQGHKAMKSPELSRRHATMVEDEESAALWKQDICILSLLRWVTTSLDIVTTKRNWALIVPPILTLIDDVEVRYKVIGSQLLSQLLSTTTPDLLEHTGLGQIFHDAMSPCLSYLPSLTAEDESIEMLGVAYPCLIDLAHTRYPLVETSNAKATTISENRAAYLSDIVQSHLLTSLSHLGEGHPQLLAVLFDQLAVYIRALEIHSVVHLIDVIPLVINVMASPFAVYVPSLLNSVAITLQSVIANGWPCMSGWRGDIFEGLCKCYIQVVEEEEALASQSRDNNRDKTIYQLEILKDHLLCCVAMMVRAVKGSEQEGKQVDIRAELKQMMDIDPRLQPLLTDYDTK